MTYGESEASGTSLSQQVCKMCQKYPLIVEKRRWGKYQRKGKLPLNTTTYLLGPSRNINIEFGV